MNRTINREMRKFIRHPSDIPIEVYLEDIITHSKEYLNNIGIGGSMETAVVLLKMLKNLLLPDGEILGTAMDWTKSVRDVDKRYYSHQDQKGKPGVLRIRFQYMDQLSEWIEIWNTSREQLHEVARLSGLEIAELNTFSHDQG